MIYFLRILVLIFCLFSFSTGKDTVSKKKRTPKQTFTIDFDDIDELLEDFDKKFEVPARITSTMMSKKTIQNASSDKYLLPEDVHYDLSMLMKPFHINSIKLISKTAGGAAADQRTDFVVVYADNEDVQVARQNMNNDNTQADVQNDGGDDDDDVYGEYGMQVFGGTDMPFDGGFGEDFTTDVNVDSSPPQDSEAVAEATELCQESVNLDINSLQSELPLQQSPSSAHPDGVKDSYLGTMKLVEAPRQVEKLKVKYATRAKRVDVRALKHHLLQNLKTVPQRTPQPAQTQVEENHDPIEDSRHENDRIEGAFFSEIVQNVRETQLANRSTSTSADAILPDADFSDVSVPFCFICMLHLCNENNLELTGREDLSDFVIHMPPVINT